MLARASTSLIAPSTYLKNPRKSCQRIFTRQSSTQDVKADPDCPSMASKKADKQSTFQESDRGHRLHFAKKANMCLNCLRLLWDLRAGQDGRFSKNKIWRSSIFNAGGKSLAKLSSFLRARIEDALKQCLWNLEQLAFDPGQHELSEC